ncbi:MAG TPA: methyltransferase domain-containing protein [Solirubrobacteraceae bacterium]|nr:methyltransferase domain-containing protein [Solirubrobacteraceae bacterium]
MLQFDAKQAKQVESTYMTPDVVDQRRATRALLDLRPGETVLDIGSGPGFLADEMAAEVGPEGAVHGVDPSESMLAIARRRETRVAYATGDALALPFADETFDAVVSTQVYEYVTDMPAALAEARRVLRPGGRVLVLDTDWDAVVWHSNDRDRMMRVLEKWNDHLADPYLPRRLPRLLRDAGFELTSTTVIPIVNQGSRTDTLSHGVMPLIADFVDDQGWKDDLLAMGEDYFFSLNRYVFVAYRS